MRPARKIVIMAALWAVSLGPPAAAGAPFQNCDSRRLQAAEGHYNNRRYADAIGILQTLTGCPDTIGEKAKALLDLIQTRQACGDLRDRALRARSNEEICSQVLRFESQCAPDPSVADLKARAGGCIIRNPEEDRLFEEANDALTRGDPKTARRKAAELQSRNPSYSGLAELMQEIAEAEGRGSRPESTPAQPRPVPKAQITQPPVALGSAPVNHQPPASASEPASGILPPHAPPPSTGGSEQYLNAYRDAQRYFEGRDYYTARSYAQSALTYRRGDEPTLALIQQIDDKIEFQRGALRKALAAYYSGQYDECHQLLDGLITSSQASPLTEAIAEFYLGATALSSFLLTGEKDQDLKAEALEHFRNSVAKPVNFSPPRDRVSERVLGQFDEVTGGSRPKP